jgi:predicted aspartyl protease
MKHQLQNISFAVFLFFLLNPLFIIAQTVIKMKNDGGVSILPCRVNGIELQFIFETGASNVSISSTEATFMLKNGFLKPEDILGKSNYIDANGKISEGILINLKDFQIGDIKLNNIIASVTNNEIAPLLLGPP